MLTASVASIADLAYGHILGKILRCELKPGDWVDRRLIAKQLCASLMPVSEAVQRLEMEGYLVSVPRRGTQVRVPSREDLRGQFWLREAIECQSARLYAGAIVQHAFDELLPLAEAADSFAVEHAAAWQRDWDFHRALVQLPQVPSLINVFDRTVRLVQFHCIALLPNYPTSRTESHTLLLRDLTQPDADAAESRLRQHLRVGLEHIWN